MKTDPLQAARAHFEAGIADFGAGRFAEAEASFAQALKLAPGRPSVLVNLAAARLRQSRPGAAEEALTALAQLLPPMDRLPPQGDPSLAEAWLLRGHAFGASGDEAASLACYRQVHPASPQATSARFHAGETLYRLRRHAEALAEFDALLTDAPRAETWWRHGLTLQALDRDDEALASHEAALALDGTLPDAWTQRGLLLKDRGRLEEAAHCFRQSLVHGGEPALNGWWLATVTGGEGAPPQAPAEYVRRLFDGYAERFDQHLVEVLQYHAPEQLVQQIERQWPGRRYAHALDLGCGTGLAAPLLRGGPALRADRLDGIDLSPGMLAQARARGLYHTLHEGDLVTVLDSLGEAANGGFDLVLAIDVFIYVGALEALFAAVRRVLQPGGVFGFSVERADDTLDHPLQASQRYAHSQRYLQALADRHGMLMREVSVQVLRQQQQTPVEGLLVVLQG